MSESAAQPSRTKHALLVLLGQYAQHLGLIQALLSVPLHQKTYIHSPQTKVLEFLVAVRAGLPHLEDISQGGRPLDQDQALVLAWQQPAWADYSGVGRTLQALTQAEAEAIGRVLTEISRPFIDEQVTQALTEQGHLIYDGDLTGRPVSNTSTTYPAAAYVHMDDEVRLGYQAAVVSVRSPTYGRHWRAVKPHLGNLVSCLQAEELVLAAETATGVRPWRRTAVLAQRLQALRAERQQAEQRLNQRQSDLVAAQAELQVRQEHLQAAETRLAEVTADYANRQRVERPHSKLAQTRKQMQTRQCRCARQAAVVTKAAQQVERQTCALGVLQAHEAALRQRLTCFEHENATNGTPVHAVFSLDAGFGTWDNVALLIEMGYEVYTRPHNHRVRDSLLWRITAATGWTRVGDNAEMVASGRTAQRLCVPGRFCAGALLHGQDPTLQRAPALRYGCRDHGPARLVHLL